MTLAAPPAWLGVEDDIAKQRTASVVFSFHDINDAQTFKKQQTIFILGMPCNTAAYEECPCPIYCGCCGSLAHREMSCKGTCCQVCMSAEHLTADHPAETKPKCINCGHEHKARSRDCSRLAKILGRPATTSDRPTGGGSPVNGLRKKNACKAKEVKSFDEDTADAQGFMYRGNVVPESEMVDIREGIHGPSSQWLNKFHRISDEHVERSAAEARRLSQHPAGVAQWGEVTPYSTMQTLSAGPSTVAKQTIHHNQ